MWTPEDRELVGDYGSGQRLTDDQWRLMQTLIPPAKPGGRPRTTDMRHLLDSLFDLLRTGCQWRHLPPPPAFLSWPTAYGYFRAFLRTGVWEGMRHHLVVLLREGVGCGPSSTAGTVEPRGLPDIDSQSVKTTEAGGPRGYDAAKKVTGRKRHIAVDTQGLLLGVVVHAASIQDADGAGGLLGRVKPLCCWLRRVRRWRLQPRGSPARLLPARPCADRRQPPAGNKRLRRAAAPLDRRTNARLARPLAAPVPGLRTPARGVRSHGHLHHDPPHAPPRRPPKPQAAPPAP